MVLKKKLFEDFQDSCLVHGHLLYLNGMIWAIHGLHFALMPPIKFLLKRIYGLEEDIVWSTQDSCHGGTKQWFCRLWVYNPQSNALQLSHCGLQICRWFLEFWSVQNSYLTTLSLCNIYMAVPFYTHWYYTTRQHTNTLFCGGNNISVSVIWTNPIYIKVNCHVLRQQLNCFGLKFCNCCLWIWRLSIWLVTSSYTVLMIQETLSLRHYIAHLFHWPSRPGQKTSGYDQELPQSQTTDGAVRNK